MKKKKSISLNLLDLICFVLVLASVALLFVPFLKTTTTGLGKVNVQTANGFEALASISKHVEEIDTSTLGSIFTSLENAFADMEELNNIADAAANRTETRGLMSVGSVCIILMLAFILCYLVSFGICFFGRGKILYTLQPIFLAGALLTSILVLIMMGSVAGKLNALSAESITSLVYTVKNTTLSFIPTIVLLLALGCTLFKRALYSVDRKKLFKK
ncbi:MAG: hypothetical protein IJF71_01705 [Clostridia bacterium]|nr:hypothetical protein [Clostridia bacterium]